MNNADTIAIVRKSLLKLLRNLRADRNCMFVPPVPENPPLPAGHFHTLPEIFIQIGGYTNFTLPWQSFRLSAGQACIIPPYTPHQERFFHHHHPFFYLVGAISYEAIYWHEGHLNNSNLLKTTPSIACRSGEMNRLIQLLRETAYLGSRSGRYAKLQLKSSMILSCAAILEAMENSNRQTQIENPKVSYCRLFIHNNLNDKNLCVKSLANNIKCSPNYLSSLFRQHTGIKMTDYINTHRLERVKDLLLHSTMNISQVARSCGYADPGYMTRLFVKTFGVNPRTYKIRSNR